MGHHATIGRSLRPAPRVKVTDRRVMSNPVQLGNDVRVILNGVADKRGYMGAGIPATSPQDIASPALGAEFKSPLAKSVVTVGDWRKTKDGWMIFTQRHGYLRAVNGIVMLNRDKLGHIDMTTLTSKTGRDNLITMVIAGTVPQVMIKRDKPKADKRERVTEINPVFVIYAVKGTRKIRYTVPADKTCGEIVDDMIEKGYDIARIANS
jgi:hypothetical protein